MSYGSVGKWLLGAALVLAVMGGVLLLLDHFGVDRLPGDITWKRDGISVYIPIGMMILLSVILTIILNLILRR